MDTIVRDNPKKDLEMRNEIREKSILVKLNETSIYFQKANDLYDIEDHFIENRKKTVRLKEHVSKLKSDVIEKEKEVHELQNINKEFEIKVDLKKKEVQEACLEISKRKEELDGLRLKKISLEKDLKKKRDDMIREFNSYNILCHNYKKFFDCHIFLEKPNIVVFEFEKRQECNVPSKFFVKLSTSDSGKTFELLEIHPEIEDQDKLAKQLLRTNNVTNLLVYLRKQFKPLLMKK